MMNNKQLQWGIGAALLLINVIVAVVLVRRRRMAQRTRAQVVSDAASDALHTLEERADELAEASRRGIKRARRTISKRSPF
jgi:cytochrome c-type biogenesis protein CcmH/NrfF